MVKFCIFKNWGKATPGHPDYKTSPDTLIEITTPGTYRLAMWENKDKKGNPYFKAHLEPYTLPPQPSKEEVLEGIAETREMLRKKNEEADKAFGRRPLPSQAPDF